MQGMRNFELDFAYFFFSTFETFVLSLFSLCNIWLELDYELDIYFERSLTTERVMQNLAVEAFCSL